MLSVEAVIVNSNYDSQVEIIYRERKQNKLIFNLIKLFFQAIFFSLAVN